MAAWLSLEVSLPFNFFAETQSMESRRASPAFCSGIYFCRSLSSTQVQTGSVQRIFFAFSFFWCCGVRGAPGRFPRDLFWALLLPQLVFHAGTGRFRKTWLLRLF